MGLPARRVSPARPPSHGSVGNAFSRALKATPARLRFVTPDNDMSQREHYLFVCTNRRDETDPRGSCTLRGSAEVRQALKDQLAATGLASLRARVCASSCLDQCSSGVTILVEPDHFFYGRVTLADVPEIVDGLAQNKRVERLVLTDEDLRKD